jgi:TatD DNase family protein
VSPRLADTHAHLADPALLPRVAEVVAAATAAGIARILAVGTDVATSAACVDVASAFPEVYAAVGVHPHESAAADSVALDAIRRLAGQPKVVAIGEIGLDFYRDHAPTAVQVAAFLAQLRLAAELGLPVVVHNREADAEIVRCLAQARRETGQPRRGVLHCFSGSRDLADRARDLGFVVSFAGNLTFRNAEALRRVAAALPGDLILTETDSPYLAPVPFRGRVNAPANVVRVVETLAEVRAESFDTIARQTYDNADELFGWQTETSRAHDAAGATEDVA